MKKRKRKERARMCLLIWLMLFAALLSACGGDLRQNTLEQVSNGLTNTYGVNFLYVGSYESEGRTVYQFVSDDEKQIPVDANISPYRDPFYLFPYTGKVFLKNNMVQSIRETLAERMLSMQNCDLADAGNLSIAAGQIEACLREISAAFQDYGIDPAINDVYLLADVRFNGKEKQVCIRDIDIGNVEKRLIEAFE